MVILFIICLFILFIGFYFHNKKWDPKRAHFYPRGETIKIGHRGAPTLARENTLESFEIAFQTGLKGIELDVQFSKDDKLVVFHDWCIKNLNGKYENIHAMDYSDILLISQRENFHIPLLNEVLENLPEERFINIEIKSPFYLNLSLVKKVVNAIQQYNIQKYAIVSSFNAFNVLLVKKLCPELSTAYLWSSKNSSFLFNSPLWIWICQPDGLYIDINDVNEKLINWAQRKKLSVFAFTVNNLSQLSEVKQLKLDGIFTDDPYLKLSSSL